jgi:hypothetical protein
MLPGASTRRTLDGVPGRECVEFLDEQGRPVATMVPDDPELVDASPPTLPRWLDPRTSPGRTVLGTLLVVLAAWVLSARQAELADMVPAPPPRAHPVASAADVVAHEPVGPGTYQDGQVGTLSGPARMAAKLLGRLGVGDGVVPSGDISCAPRPQSAAAQLGVAAALRAHLPSYSVITATTGFGTHAKICTVVMWAEHRSTSVVVSIEAPSRGARPSATRWQALSAPSGTLEWVRRVDTEGWTVLVGSFGVGEVPGLSALIQLTHDPRLIW